MMNLGRRILLALSMLAASAASAAARPEEPPVCRAGGEGQYVIWNFDQGTSSFFDPKEMEDELAKLQDDAAERLGTLEAPALKGLQCRNDALLAKLETRHELADLGDFVLVGLSARGKDFEVHIIPYIVNHDWPRLITHGACTQAGPVPSVNAYRAEIRAYAYAALALAEIRRLDPQHNLCRVRHAQYFLDRALSALAVSAEWAGSDPVAAEQLQRHLKEKRAWLRPLIEAAAKMTGRCGMPIQSPQLSALLPKA